ncbi:MAG: hypothetical protein LKF42_09210 [Streptococcaceae bacterium]|jgi:hypothetical protein|nr:hypothetical protein [Streptococcaceae bacterium]MCH4178122.1 hypothetical protein [Streptococcaceae bacterium]
MKLKISEISVIFEEGNITGYRANFNYNENGEFLNGTVKIPIDTQMEVVAIESAVKLALKNKFEEEETAE